MFSLLPKVVPVSLVCSSTVFFSLSSLSADIIDLSRPVNESLSTITGIYISANTTLDDTSTPDLSGNGYDLLFYQGSGVELPSLTTGVNRPGTSGFGNGIRLNTTQTTTGDPGNPRLSLTMPVTNNLAMSNVSFTAGAWLNYNSMISGNQYTIIMDRGGFNIPSSSSNTGETYGHWGLALQKSSTGLWRMELNMGDGLGTSRLYSGAYSDWGIQVNEWNHFGFTFSYDPEGDNTVEFFLNGEFVGSATTARNITAGANYTPTRTFSVGERTVSTRLSLFDGSVDDIFVTEGVHTFVQPIPEPGTALLLTLFGTLCIVSKRYRDS